LEKERKKRNVC